MNLPRTALLLAGCCYDDAGLDRRHPEPLMTGRSFTRRFLAHLAAGSVAGCLSATAMANTVTVHSALLDLNYDDAETQGWHPELMSTWGPFPYFSQGAWSLKWIRDAGPASTGSYSDQFGFELILHPAHPPGAPPGVILPPNDVDWTKAWVGVSTSNMQWSVDAAVAPPGDAQFMTSYGHANLGLQFATSNGASGNLVHEDQARIGSNTIHYGGVAAGDQQQSDWLHGNWSQSIQMPMFATPSNSPDPCLSFSCMNVLPASLTAESFTLSGNTMVIAASVPEPNTGWILMVGLGLLGWVNRNTRPHRPSGENRVGTHPA